MLHVRLFDKKKQWKLRLGGSSERIARFLNFIRRFSRLQKEFFKFYSPPLIDSVVSRERRSFPVYSQISINVTSTCTHTVHMLINVFICNNIIGTYYIVSWASLHCSSCYVACKALLQCRLIILHLLFWIQKGFPKDATLDQLEEFFADKGKVYTCLLPQFCQFHFTHHKQWMPSVDYIYIAITELSLLL